MGDLVSLLTRLVPPLLLVVGALLALRRWGRPPAVQGEVLRVIARTGLTRSAVVAVVAVGRRRFLLGASDSGVRMLRELEPAPEHDTPNGGTDPAVPLPRSGLVDWLRERTLRVSGGSPWHDGRT
ncbi:MAG TPA: flagellar biosynthetic protein FliO [Euzebyales bacterium]|nr:flagellar biosynthetic protein FliO [Euzebyales bacterium]